MLPSLSLFNKIIEGNIDVIKTMNLLHQIGSLSCLFSTCIYNRAFHIQEGQLLASVIRIKYLPL